MIGGLILCLVLEGVCVLCPEVQLDVQLVVEGEITSLV